MKHIKATFGGLAAVVFLFTIVAGFANVVGADGDVQKRFFGVLLMAGGGIGMILGRFLNVIPKREAKSRRKQTAGKQALDVLVKKGVFDPATGGVKASVEEPAEYRGMAAFVENHNLIDFLETGHPRDPEQWHCMVGAAETYEDFQAAFWIMSQPECDQATVSNFIKSVSFKSEIIAARPAQKLEMADQIEAIITRWNDGFYANQRFFSLAVDEKVQGRFKEDNQFIAKLLKRHPWPEPRGIFRKFEGKIPEPSVCLWDD